MKKAELFAYQKVGIQGILDFGGRCLLADEQGLGKTWQAIHAAERLGGSTIVVCPAVVKYKWQHEIRIRTGRQADIAETQTAPIANGMQTGHKWLVINYDILKHWLPYLKSLDPKTVVFDESQYLANRTTGRTKAARDLSRKAPYVIALSGTPLMNSPAELWPTLNMLRPDLYRNFFTYGRRYCGAKLKRWGWEYKGAENLPELHAILKEQFMIRRLKIDVLPDLPDKIIRVIPCHIRDRAQYQHATNDFLVWLQRHNANKVHKAQKAEAMVKVGYLRRLVAKLKLRSIVDWVNHHLEETDEKLVMFANHRKMLEAMNRRCNAKSVMLYGGINSRKKKAIVDQFQNDRDTRLFLGNSAASVGIDLVAANTLGFAELWWNPAMHSQAMDRIHRIGQLQKTWINYFIAQDTIEDRIFGILQDRQAVNNAVLDGFDADMSKSMFNEFISGFGKG